MISPHVSVFILFLRVSDVLGSINVNLKITQRAPMVTGCMNISLRAIVAMLGMVFLRCFAEIASSMRPYSLSERNAITFQKKKV